MNYRAAVVGCGRIGYQFDQDPKIKYIATHTGAYTKVEQTDLVAVCDTNIKKLKKCTKTLKKVNGYTDLKKMLKEEKIDILSICTPPASHHSVLKEAAKFPLKAIFCEKPLADNLKDAEEMIRLCQRKNIILQIDHQRRFDPLHIKLRKMIRDKKFGDVQQANFYYTAGIKNTGSHMFDLLRFFFGEVEWLKAFFSKNKSPNKDDPNTDGILKFKNGLLATFQALDVKDYLIFELNCFFQKGKIVLKSSGFGLDFFQVGESKYFSGYKELEKTKGLFDTNYKRNFMVNGVGHLINCVESKKKSNSSGKDGLKALKLVKASIFSAKHNGRKVSLKKVK